MNTLKETIEWLADNIILLCLGAVAVFFVIDAAYSIRAEKAERDEFMRECRQYRKQYECTALLRDGEKTPGFCRALNSR